LITAAQNIFLSFSYFSVEWLADKIGAGNGCGMMDVTRIDSADLLMTEMGSTNI